MVAPAVVAAGLEFRLWVLVLVVYLKINFFLCINLFELSKKRFFFLILAKY